MPIDSQFQAVTNGMTTDEVVTSTRSLLQEKGYAYLDQIPENFDYLAFAQHFGCLLPHKYNSEYVFSIKIDPKLGENYPAFTTNCVEPHTEGYEYDQIPLHYQCLWCVKPPTCGGGHTLLADGYRFVDSLAEADREYITQNQFEFVTPNGRIVKHPLYDVKSCQQPIVRFNFSSLKRDNPRLERIARSLLQFFENEKIVIQWSKNALLIWDNFRLLHSRTGYQDRNRELKRLYIQ